MDANPGQATIVALEEKGGRACVERRSTGERRRSSRGWLEMRARREGVEIDRRRRARASGWWAQIKLVFWRRDVWRPEDKA